MKKSIGDICEILNGYSFKSEKYTNEGVRVIRIANVQNGYIEDATPQFYPNSEIDSFKDFLLQKNDLLISLTGNVGRVALLDEKFLPAALNQRVACLRPKSTAVSTKFLFYALSSERFIQDCEDSARGVAQKNMSTEWLKKYFINLPDAGTQLYWIKTLDVVTELIKKRKLQLRYLDQLASSRFIEMFGDSTYQERNISEVCKIVTDGTHQSPKFTDSGIPFLFVSNIVDNAITYETSKFISVQTYNELTKRTPIEIGDILLTIVGSYGNPAVVKSDKPFCFQRHLAYMKLKTDIIHPEYLHAAFLSANVKEQIERKVKGIAQKTLNLSELKSIHLPLPPLELQNEFAAFVEQLDKSKVTIRKSIEKLETTYRALLQEYFG